MQAFLYFQAFGVYAPFWMAEFGWNRTTISLIHSLRRTESGLLGPFHGWLLKTFGVQRVVLCGLVLLGSGFIAFGLVQNTSQFIIVFIAMSIGASLSGFMSLMTLVVNWFDRYKSRAMAIIGLGMSIGGLFLPIIAWLMVTWGWRAVAIASGLLFLFLAWPLGRILVSEPGLMGLRLDGNTAGSAGEGSDVALAGESVLISSSAVTTDNSQLALNTRAILRTKEFWLLSVSHSQALAIVGAVTVHFVIYAGDALQLGITTAAVLVTLITISQIVGQLAGGFFGDRYDKRWMAGIGMVMHAVAMGNLIWATSLSAVVVSAVLHGLAWGFRGPLMSAMYAEYFGRNMFAIVMGFSSMVLMVGQILGPLLIGFIADSTGAYGLAFGILAILGLFGVLALILMPPPGRLVESTDHTSL